MSRKQDFPYEKHFLVCTGSRCNDSKNGKDRGDAIRSVLKVHNRQMGRKKSVRVCGVSCLDLCDEGPNMVVWPEGVVHTRLECEDAMRIYTEVMGDGEK